MKTNQQARIERAAQKDARDAAWSLYVIEYTSAVDDDPGDARARYFETLRRLDAIERGQST